MGSFNLDSICPDQILRATPSTEQDTSCAPLFRSSFSIFKFSFILFPSPASFISLSSSSPPMDLSFLMDKTMFCSLETEKSVSQRKIQFTEYIHDMLNFQNLRVCFQTHLMIILKHTAIVLTFKMCCSMHHNLINHVTSNY